MHTPNQPMQPDEIFQMKDDFAQHVRDLQNQITQELKTVDPSIHLTEDHWERKDHLGEAGGGGITRAFTGQVIENAGVNTSLVFGNIDPQFAKNLGKEVQQQQKQQQDHSLSPWMWATGISLIIHPRSPKIPTVHANFRMIQVGTPHSSTFWFGGGADLSPYYPYEEDFDEFHDTWKEACEPFHCYNSMKKWCDEYFVNHHRLNEQGESEMRGIGGIFFDHYHTNDPWKDMSMVKHLSRYFIPSYFPIVKKRLQERWTKEDEDFQLFRHGRYVEFNLLHDRGTLFGLKTNGRTDSILISLPARCEFHYRYQPKGALQEKMMSYYHPYPWGKRSFSESA